MLGISFDVPAAVATAQAAVAAASSDVTGIPDLPPGPYVPPVQKKSSTGQVVLGGIVLGTVVTGATLLLSPRKHLGVGAVVGGVVLGGAVLALHRATTT